MDHFCGGQERKMKGADFCSENDCTCFTHMHKWANVHKGSGLDRRSKSDPQRAKEIQSKKKIEGAMAMLMDELSMVPPDVYHAGTFRFATSRQERLMLEIARYLEQWFRKMPIGVQLADFLKLRPTARLSLCEWLDARRATDVWNIYLHLGDFFR